MGMVAGLENADMALQAYTPTEEPDRMGDPVEVPDWTTIIEIPVRFQTKRELTRSEYGRIVDDDPAVYVEPSRIPDDLHETHDALDDDAEWPYVSPDRGRAIVDGRPYEVTGVRERSVASGPRPDVLVLSLNEVA